MITNWNEGQKTNYTVSKKIAIYVYEQRTYLMYCIFCLNEDLVIDISVAFVRQGKVGMVIEYDGHRVIVDFENLCCQHI